MVIKFDNSAKVFELFTNAGEWRGCFDTKDDALAEMAKVYRAARIAQNRRDAARGASLRGERPGRRMAEAE